MPSLFLAIVFLLSCLLVFSPSHVFVTASSGSSLYFSIDVSSVDFFSAVVDLYKFVKPADSVFMTKTATNDAKESFFNNEQDFMVISAPLSMSERNAHPNLSSFPIVGTAIVPIYNLAPLDQSSPPLVFTRQTLVRIFIGQIAYWDDPALQASNPGVPLPHMPIQVVVITEPGARNLAFVSALQAFDPTFSSYVSVTDNPSWPSNFTRASGEIGVNIKTSQTNGAISYSAIPQALKSGNLIGSIVNQAGAIVEATEETVTIAMVDSCNRVIGANKHFLTIAAIDSPAKLSWPIVIVSYGIFDLEYSRSSCADRAAMVDFMLWILESTAVGNLLKEFRSALTPQYLLAELTVTEILRNQVLCLGVSMASRSLVSHYSIDVLNPPSLSPLVSLLFNTLTAPDGSGLFPNTQNAVSAQLAYQKLQLGEADLLFLPSHDLSPSDFSTILADRDYSTMPLFHTLLSFVTLDNINYNLPFMKTSLTLTLNVIGAIYSGAVRSWTDERFFTGALAGQNEFLRSANQTYQGDVKITLLIDCASTETAYLLRLLYANTDEFRSFIGSLSSDLQYQWPLRYCSLLKTQAIPFISVGNADELYQYSQYVAGSISFQSLSNRVLPAVQTPALLADGHAFELRDGSYNRDHTLACFDSLFPLPALDPLAGNMNEAIAHRTLDIQSRAFTPPGDRTVGLDARCWPLASFTLAVFPASFTGDAVRQGTGTLVFLETLLKSADMAESTNALNHTALWIRPEVGQDLVNTVEYVLCDGSNCLIQLPVYWSLSIGVSIFGVIFSTIGLLFALVCLACVIVFRHSVIMKSSSPFFLLVSLAGLLMLYCSVFLLVQPPTTSLCNAWGFLTSFSFSMIFLPLLLKTWRIFQIFGKRKLKIVKISNKRLGAYVGGGLLVEFIILCAWVSMDNGGLKAASIARTDSGQAASHLYNHCLVNDNGGGILILLAVYKGLLILFGSLMSFSVRNVSSQFNESKQIGFILYNLFGSVPIILVVIFLTNAVGDVLVLLLVFLSVWIGLFTNALLLGPKLNNLRLDEKTLSHLSYNNSAKTVSKGFEFISFHLMDYSTLRIYFNALEEQTDQCRLRLKMMEKEERLKSGGGGGSSSGNALKAVGGFVKGAMARMSQLTGDKGEHSGNTAQGSVSQGGHSGSHLNPGNTRGGSPALSRTSPNVDSINAANTLGLLRFSVPNSVPNPGSECETPTLADSPTPTAQ